MGGSPDPGPLPVAGEASRGGRGRTVIAALVAAIHVFMDPRNKSAGDVLNTRLRMTMGNTKLGVDYAS